MNNETHVTIRTIAWYALWAVVIICITQCTIHEEKNKASKQISIDCKAS